LGGLSCVGAAPLQAAESQAAADDRYVVPDGGLPELIAFIQRVSQYRPTSVQADIQHRSQAPRALRQAAEKILQLDKESNSDACQAARFLVILDRVRSLPQGDPDQQQQTVADASKYVSELVAAGQKRVAADVAIVLGQTLLCAGEWRQAVDTYRALSGLFADSQNERLVARMRVVEAEIPRVLATIAEFEAAGPKPVIRPAGRLIPLDLQAKWNRKMVDFSGSGAFEGNGLAELPLGEHTFRGVTFRVGEGVVQLGSTNAPTGLSQAEGIPVQRKIARLYALHATQWGAATPPVSDGTAVGEFRLHYEDGAAVSLPIVYGEDVRDWWSSDLGKPVKRGVVVWTGNNLNTEQYGVLLRLYLSVWDNPQSDKPVTTVDFVSTMKTPAAPFCVALTVEERVP
jgi:hypothetical protein